MNFQSQTQKNTALGQCKNALRQCIFLKPMAIQWKRFCKGSGVCVQVVTRRAEVILIPEDDTSLALRSRRIHRSEWKIQLLAFLMHS